MFRLLPVADTISSTVRPWGASRPQQRRKTQMPQIDAHCQFWRASDIGLPPSVSAPEPALARDFTPDALPGTMPVVAIQAVPNTAGTDYLLSLNSPRIAGVIGWADLASPGVTGHLSDRMINPRFRGIRLMLRRIADDDWLLTAPDPAVISMLTQVNLTLDIEAAPRHLQTLAQFAALNPDLPLVVDQAGVPNLETGQPDDEWAAGMAALAANPQACCKIAGLLALLSPAQQQDPLAALQPLFNRLLDWFGPNRLIWGSDWPTLTLNSQYTDWMALSAELLHGLGEAEQQAIMGDNAARFYGLVLKA